MNRLLLILKVIVYALLAAILAGVLWEGIRLRPSVESGLRAFNVNMRESGLTLKNIREASGEWEKASKAQAEESSAALSSINSTVARLNTFVGRLDAQLNGSVLPTFGQAVSQQNQSLLQTQEQLRANLREFQKATASLDVLITDSSLKQSLVNLEAATRDMDASLQQLNVMLQSGTATAQDIQEVADKFREQYVKARNIWLGLAQGLFKAAFTVRGALQK